MNERLIPFASRFAVVFAWLLLGKHGDEFAAGQLILLIFAATLLTNILLVPRWPKSGLLKATFRRLKPGQRITVEGE